MPRCPLPNGRHSSHSLAGVPYHNISGLCVDVGLTSWALHSMGIRASSDSMYVFKYLMVAQVCSLLIIKKEEFAFLS